MALKLLVSETVNPNSVCNVYNFESIFKHMKLLLIDSILSSVSFLMLCELPNMLTKYTEAYFSRKKDARLSYCLLLVYLMFDKHAFI